MRSRTSVRALLPVTLAALLPLAACGEITKVQECNKAIEVINASKVGQSASTDKKKLEEEAKLALDLDKKLEEVKLSDEGLKKHIEDYRKNMKDYADFMNKAAKVGDGDVDAAKLLKQASEVTSKNSELVSKINGYCTGGAK